MLARLDVSKNANVQGNEQAKAVLTVRLPRRRCRCTPPLLTLRSATASAQSAVAKRPPTELYGAFNLLMKDEPGQKWSPEGFHDVVKWV